jgi:hypothetical protein
MTVAIKAATMSLMGVFLRDGGNRSRKRAGTLAGLAGGRRFEHQTRLGS